MSIEEKYQHFCATPSDINELLPRLYEYSNNREFVITEFGTRHCVSAYAFLRARPKKFVTYDIVRYPEVDELEAIAAQEGVDMAFRQANVLNIDIEPTDILFIDTFHVAQQCRAELERHADKVLRRIIFHDTNTFWENGELAYEGVVAGQPRPDGSNPGLRYAIEPFMAAHPEWRLVYRTESNNGLLILERPYYAR